MKVLVIRGIGACCEALAAAVAGGLDSHQARVEAVLHIAFEDAVLDQHRLAGRRAFVVDRKRSAAAATDRALHRAVVDDGDARRRDALADAAREGARALAVEIAFEPVADGFVQQHAGPAGAEQHGDFARGGIDRAQIDERLRQRLVDRAVPLRGLEQMIVQRNGRRGPK
jgi:fructose-specific component phosphotransferase system IIB-like protein